MGQEDDSGVLYEGVPPWMELAVQNWILSVAPNVDRVAQLTNEFEQRTRSRQPMAVDVTRVGWAVLWQEWNREAELIPFIDFLLAKYPAKTKREAERRDRFEADLVRCGSAWKVGARDGFPGLERRVPLGVQESAEHTMLESGRAGERLSEAWHSAFGVSPNPTLAYALAVRAVEDATIPKVTPNQMNASLGHVIGQLRNHGDWSLPLTREDPDAPTSETVIRMCKALWRGHHDRHGGDLNTPVSVSQAEAEAAVLLAVPLVQWFMSGAVARH